MDKTSSSQTDVLGAWHNPALESPHSVRWAPLPSETAWAHTRCLLAVGSHPELSALPRRLPAASNNTLCKQPPSPNHFGVP